jgi:pyruvate kinase
VSSRQDLPRNLGDSLHTETSQLVRLRGEVDDLLAKLGEAESSWAPWLDNIVPEHRSSARNLVHCWAIRQIDLRGPQARLTSYGLSSLGRSEPHVQATLFAVRSALAAMLDEGWQPPPPPAVRIDEGAELLRRRTLELLGAQPDHRLTRIMVTPPSEAATSPELVHDLVQRGMNITRINCAHDDRDEWRAMAIHVRQAAAAAGTTCLVAMDLGGPKLRTGPLQPGPRVARLRPGRDALGQVVAPARAWLTSAQDPADPPRSAWSHFSSRNTG